MAQAGPADFDPPQQVELRGYDGHAMEPFISRDGQWLFFNNRNQPKDQTDIHIARRVDDLTFDYLGPLPGANSDELDGVPSIDAAGRIYLVSPRAYDDTHNTLWTGEFQDQALTNLHQLAGDASRNKPLWLSIDAEISADGDTLYFTDNRWRLFGGGLKGSNIIAARRDEAGAFNRLADNEAIFAAINTDKLEFAPATTPDELTLYFTRVDRKALKKGVAQGFGIYVATRPEASSPFGEPERIEALSGYVEGPTVSPDGCAIYFHQLVDDVFQIMRAQKSNCSE